MPRKTITESVRNVLLAAGMIFWAGCIFASPETSDAPEAKSIRFAENGVEFEFVWIAPGTFLMGSDPDEPARDKAEGPQTLVTLTKGFWLGRTEVTQELYETIAGANPSRFTDIGPQAPVERVSWEDAMEFCTLLNEREPLAGRLPEGFQFALPTEAQWEYACRAGTTSAYTGDPHEIGWSKENSDESTHTVATLQPNDWGLYDMPGNVLEWCADWYGPYPGGKVADPAGPSHGYFRMARGGSWRTGVEVLRSAARAGGSPGRQDYTIGFRLALGSQGND